MLFDADTRQVLESETKLEYSPRVAADGTAEVDPDVLGRLARRAIGGTLARASHGATIGVVGVSTFWHGLLGLDGERRPLTPVILWSDTRSWRQSQRLKRELDAEAVWQRTGCPIHPSYWPSKLAWLRETEPDTWARVRHWVSPGDFLYLRLFGELGTSASMASGTGLRRLEGGWDGELLDRLGIDAAALPPEVGEMSGLLPEAARLWPALTGSIWLTPAGDGALANLGSGSTGPHRRALTVGTSGALRALSDRRPEVLARGLWCYLLEPGRYVVGGSLSNGGNLYAWMLNTLRIDQRGLEERLQAMPPAATGLTVLPLLAGERSLGFAPRATGAVAGLTQATTAEELLRAGMEAVAMTFAGVDEALDRTVPGASQLMASGHGLVSSAAWAQMMADAIGKPVALSEEAMEASSRGAAVQAVARLGIQPLTEVRTGRTFEPRPAAHMAYQEARRRQQWLYSTLIEGSAVT
jgi:gluconokinase